MAVEAVFFENQNWKAAQLASGTNSLFLSAIRRPPSPTCRPIRTTTTAPPKWGSSTNSSLRNFELNYLQATTFSRITALAGYRYVDFHDQARSDFDLCRQLRWSQHKQLLDRRPQPPARRSVWTNLSRALDLFTFELGRQGGRVRQFFRTEQVVYDQNSTVTLRNTPRQTKQAVAFVGDIGMNGVMQLSGNFFARFGYNVLWIDHRRARAQSTRLQRQCKFRPRRNQQARQPLHARRQRMGLEARW